MSGVRKPAGNLSWVAKMLWPSELRTQEHSQKWVKCTATLGDKGNGTSNVPFPYLGTGHVIMRESAVNVDSLSVMLMYNFLHVHHILIESYSFSLIFLFLYMWGLGGLFVVFGGMWDCTSVYLGVRGRHLLPESSSSTSRLHPSLSALGAHRLVRLRGWWVLGIHPSSSPAFYMGATWTCLGPQACPAYISSTGTFSITWTSVSLPLR